MLRIKNFVSSKVKARKDKKFNEKFNFNLKHGDHRITIKELEDFNQALSDIFEEYLLAGDFKTAEIYKNLLEQDTDNLMRVKWEMMQLGF